MPPPERKSVTDREALSLQCEVTIEFRFGAICDEVKRLVKAGVIPTNTGAALDRVIKNEGNQAIRVINNHLEHWNISRNHSKDKPNIERVAHSCAQEGLTG